MPESPFDLGFNFTKNLELVPASIGRRAAAVSPSDTLDFTDFASLHVYVGTGGDLRLLTVNGNDVTFKNVPSGTLLPIVARRIFATGTTAKDLVIDG